MSRQFSPKWTPSTRADALSLLRSVDDDIERLTRGQQEQIARLYRLHNDDRTVEDLVKAGVIH